MAFDTTTSVLVYERMTATGQQLGLRPHNLMAHRIYRNQSGEYFLVIASRDAEPPYVTHLSRDRAMIAFRDDPEAFRREFGDRGRRSFRRMLARKGGLGIQPRVPPPG
jgi:hypothetical protein